MDPLCTIHMTVQYLLQEKIQKHDVHILYSGTLGVLALLHYTDTYRSIKREMII